VWQKMQISLSLDALIVPGPETDRLCLELIIDWASVQEVMTSKIENIFIIFLTTLILTS
jgi:hypothetical protein